VGNNVNAVETNAKKSQGQIANIVAKRLQTLQLGDLKETAQEIAAQDTAT
jgi:hypothetical protein